MKRRVLCVCFIILLCAALLAACSDARATEAAKLVAGYYKEADASKVAVMGVQTYGAGYLALAAHTVDESRQLALFKIETGADGASAITAVSNGGSAKDGLYSANMLTDGGNTIVYGDAGETGCNKVTVAFDGGGEVSAKVGGKGYIAVNPGETRVKDFTLYKGGAAVGSYQGLLNAGGSIVVTGFIKETAK